jgi:hypothetical protein
VFGSEAARQTNYERQVAIDLRFNMPQARLEMDNQPAITDASSGAVRRFSQRQKHYLIAERYVQQAVEAGFLFLQHKSGAPRRRLDE